MNTMPLNKYDENAGSGLLFIPDISGFTRLVRNSDLLTGQLITQELLSTIIRHNKLSMQIAEIEGDAIFFYKWKSIPTVHELYEQFELWKTSFSKKVQELSNRYNLSLDLQLKAIAHFGQMATYRIGSFCKLYGEVVIEAHRLLKNSIAVHSYLLLTDDLMAASLDRNTCSSFDIAGKQCELYAGMRNLCFTYLV